MYLLALDTSNDACSVALSTPQGIVEQFQIAPRKHAELVLPMIEDLLRHCGVDKKQLQAIAYSAGPGAFIGVRIAASVTQGLALALQIPVVAVSSLAAMAQAYRDQASTIIVANDARMNEVYLGCYQSAASGDRATAGGVEALVADAVVKPGDIDLSAFTATRCLAIGSAWEVYAEALSLRYPQLAPIPDCYPHAAQVAELGLIKWQAGERLKVAQAQPVYLRESVVQSPT